MIKNSRIATALKLMEESLCTPFSATDAAHAACYSYFHFHRLFSALVGIAPGEYLRRRRLAVAVRMLCETEDSISRIALEVQYESGEALTKAFQGEFGISPKQIRQKLVELPTLFPFAPQTFSKDSTMEPTIFSLPSFSVLGYQIETTHDQGQNFIEIPKLWGRVMENSCALIQQIPWVRRPNVTFGICGCAPESDSQTFTYTVGVESEPTGEIPPEMALVTLVPSRYAVFTVPAGEWPQAIQDTWKIIWKWFDASELRIASRNDFERYETAPDGSCICTIWIPVEDA